MTERHFRAEFSPTKTLAMGLFGALFVAVFGILGIYSLVTSGGGQFEADSKIVEWVKTVSLSGLLFLIAYVMGMSSYRYVTHCMGRKPMTVFNDHGVDGYNGFGASRSLSWDEVDDFEIQKGLGTLILYPSDKKRSVFIGIFLSVFEYWNPEAIVIPTIYTKPKINAVWQAFIDLNPYAEERFGFRH